MLKYYIQYTRTVRVYTLIMSRASTITLYTYVHYDRSENGPRLIMTSDGLIELDPGC